MKDLDKRGLHASSIHKIKEGIKMTKQDIAWEIHKKDHYNPIGMFPESFTRIELVECFNKMFNLEIK